MIGLEELRGHVARANRAPSVHNIQPTRWRLSDPSTIAILADPARTLPSADPTGHDVRLSHGAAVEGMALSLAAAGLRISAVDIDPAGSDRIARLSIGPGASETCPEATIEARVSWRGRFRPGPHDREALQTLATRRDDLAIIDDREQIRAIAIMADQCGLHFMRDDNHRRELIHWMRLSKSHPSWHLDGLSSEAMAMSGIEAFGAGLVLGPLFRFIDSVGLSGALLAEASKTHDASAIVLFHRARGEDPFATGRAFYRAWLDMAELDFHGCPMSVLADLAASNAQLRTMAALPADRRLVNVFRIGRPAGTMTARRARLPVDALILS